MNYCKDLKVVQIVVAPIDKDFKIATKKSFL